MKGPLNWVRYALIKLLQQCRRQPQRLALRLSDLPGLALHQLRSGPRPGAGLDEVGRNRGGMEIDLPHLTQVGALPLVEMVAVLIRPVQKVARVGSVASWSERLSAAPSGIRVSASHCRMPIASSIERMRTKRASSVL